MAQLDLLNEASSSDIHSEPEAQSKSEGAYRTISEVSDELAVPQHVLRFWESRFSQIKPSRMRGGRRYYRPEDIDLLKKIKTLLYSQGYTIEGAKKVVKGEKIAPQPAVPQRIAKPISERKPTVDMRSLAGELRALKSMLAGAL